MTNFRPMLAASKFDEDKARFPLTVQPKLDGIRASVVEGKLISRNGKPIPNSAIRRALETPQNEGLDGELIAGDPRAADAFRITTSWVMSDSKGEPPQWTYFVFDRWDQPGGWIERHATLDVSAGFDARIAVVPYVTADNLDALYAVEQQLVAEGYEGAILRRPDAAYKFGRGSMTKLDLVKLKRFSDSEATVIGFEEERQNTNEAIKNAFGRTERSTAQAGKVGKGSLGKLAVRDNYSGVEFGIGTGFTAGERAALWAERDALIGRTLKYKFFPVGVKEKPRFPVFLGWRAEGDLPCQDEGRSV